MAKLIKKLMILFIVISFSVSCKQTNELNRDESDPLEKKFFAIEYEKSKRVKFIHTATCERIHRRKTYKVSEYAAITYRYRVCPICKPELKRPAK